MRPSSLKNLGPESDRMLAAVGVESADEVRRLGAPFLYKILKHRFPRSVNLIWLYALEGALQDRHWNSFTPEEKEALKASVAGNLEIG